VLRAGVPWPSRSSVNRKNTATLSKRLSRLPGRPSAGILLQAREGSNLRVVVLSFPSFAKTAFGINEIATVAHSTARLPHMVLRIDAIHTDPSEIPSQIAAEDSPLARRENEGSIRQGTRRKQHPLVFEWSRSLNGLQLGAVGLQFND
jgi:hypothetical protein